MSTTPPAPVTALPAGWDVTGGTDLSAKMSYWLCKHKDAGPYPPAPAGAKYRVDSGLTLQGCGQGDCAGGNLDLSAWGDGGAPIAKIFTDVPALDQRNRVLLRLWAVNPVKIGKMRIQGPNATKTGAPVYDKTVEGQAGIEVSCGSDTVLIDGAQIRGTLGDGIYVGANECDWQAAPKNVTIQNTTILNVQRQGMAPCYAENLVIRNCTIGNTGRSAIDLEPMGAPMHVTGVLIDNLTTFGIHLSWIAAMGQGDISNVTIQNSHANEGLLINQHLNTDQGRHDWKILGNTSNWLLGSEYPNFNLTHTKNVTIAGNHQPLIVGPTPQSRTPWTDKRMASYLLGNGCTNVTVGTKVYNDDGTVKGDSGLPPNTWQ